MGPLAFSKRHGAGPEGYVGLATLAMGDTNSVEYAQAAHWGFLVDRAGVEPARMMKMRAPIPRGMFFL